jgi:hypothetical protein
MDNKKTWLAIIISLIIIIFIIVSIKFKLTEKFGWWMFVFFLLFFAILMIILYFKPFEPNRKGMSNREVILRANELLADTPGGVGIQWSGGSSNKMGFKDFLRKGEAFRYWAIIAKSKNERWFRIIYSEKDDVLIDIDGSTATETLQDVWKNFKPFANDENELLQKMMMNNMMYGNKRQPRRRIVRMSPSDPSSSEGSSDFGQEGQ